MPGWLNASMYLDFGTLPRPLWVVESDLSLLVDGKVWEVMIGYKSKFVFRSC